MTLNAAVIPEPDLLHWNIANVDRCRLAHLPPGDIRALVRSNEELPPMPALAKQLWALRDDDNASAQSLAETIQLDPLLASQILRRANSAYHGGVRTIDSVQDAVTRLGFNTSLDFALALAALSPLRTPNQGPIGRDRLWQHGLRCSLVMQELAKQQRGAIQLPLGLVQLSGITHNIGYFLLGHLLPEQFHFLSRLIASNPGLSLPTIDRFALGVEHTQLGEWLYDAWEMPAPLLLAVRHHHNPAYKGDHEQLVLLTGLADSLLEQSGLGLGGCHPTEDHDRFLARLGLDPTACSDVIEHALAETPLGPRAP
ncbi:HDOD domain protein [Thiorhodovibrio winogradskyi]|uniref:HDOD domain protein n=1 Tax=Thiorhodovibrio winogradskyi TaxID=77007 RepID=A0ABZ0SA38_9GAMM|nr:HDOD domain-containing protein [Thiorhodovibrio winogradskyi]